MAKAKKEKVSLEELLEEAMVKEEDRPYEVPGNWVWTKVGKLLNINPQKVDVKYLDDNLECSFIPMNIVNSELGVVDECEIKPLGEVRKGYTNFIEGDVIFAKITPCMENRKSAIVPKLKNDLGYGSTEFHVFRTDSRYVYNKFIFYFVRNHEFISDATYAMTGAVGQQRVSKSFIEEYKIPLPPIAEQQRIVEVVESLFEKLDTAKELVQNALDSFENRKAAILHKAFTGELTARWREENGISLGSWNIDELKNIAEVISGASFKSEDFSEENEVSCVKITNVGVGYFDDDNVGYLPSVFLRDYKKQIVKQNDILVALTRPFINAGLKTCIYGKEEVSLLNQRVALIRGENGKYIYSYLQTSTVLNYVKEKSKTTNQPNLSIRDLEKLPIPCPIIEEQKEITRILDNLLENEQRAKELSDVIEKIDLMKKAILARAFRGELGTNNPEEESAVELLKEVLKEKI
jgi:type I restriction enzyme, S subunit